MIHLTNMPRTIASLPKELLTEILEFAILSTPLEERNTYTIPNLRLVSSLWNAVIEARAVLWTSILVTQESAHRPNQSLFQSTHTRIDRARNLPLDIAIHLSCPSTPGLFDPRDGHKLGKIVRVVASRISSFELRAPSRTLHRGILWNLHATPMPLLRSFIHVGCTDPALGRAARFDSFVEEEAKGLNRRAILQRQFDLPLSTRAAVNSWGSEMYPTLENVEIVGALYDFNHFPVMHGLRRLCIKGQPLIHRLGTNTFVEMLASARGTLEILELVDVIGLHDESVQPMDIPVVFEKLQVLSLGYGDPREAIRFLQYSDAPALTDMTLIYTGSVLEVTQRQNHDNLLVLLIRHLPLARIERLSLDNVVFTSSREETPGMNLGMPVRRPPPRFLKFLAELTSLKNLSLTDMHRSPWVKDVLWGSETLLPALETFRLDGQPEEIFDMLRNMAKLGRRSIQLVLTEELESCIAEQMNDSLLSMGCGYFRFGEAGSQR